MRHFPKFESTPLTASVHHAVFPFPRVCLVAAFARETVGGDHSSPLRQSSHAASPHR
jgi:hypothetical protein